MVSRKRYVKRNRRALTRNGMPTGASATATASLAAGKLLLNTSLPLVVTGVPKFVTVNGQSAVSVSQLSPTQIQFTYAVPAVTGADWEVKASDPAMRTSTGGFVASASGTF